MNQSSERPLRAPTAGRLGSFEYATTANTMASEESTTKETSKNPARGMAALYVTWAILTPLRAMRWTIRRLVLALALPLAVGAAFKMWLGTGPALVAGALGSLLVGWTAIGYAVREAAARATGGPPPGSSGSRLSPR